MALCHSWYRPWSYAISPGHNDRIRTGDFYDANVAMPPLLTCRFARSDLLMRGAGSGTGGH